jgi:hypothetical protein
MSFARVGEHFVVHSYADLPITWFSGKPRVTELHWTVEVHFPGKIAQEPIQANFALAESR